jgi:hypothetical protein
MKPAASKSMWDGAEVARPAAPAMAEVVLPLATREFLLEVGLPRRAAPAFEFAFPDGRLPLVSELPDAPAGLEREELQRYRLIGSTPSTLICLDLAAGARVVQIVAADDAGEAAIQFVNSSLPQLAECLVAYRNSLGEAIADDERATQRSVQAAVRYSAMDPSERAEANSRLMADPGAVARAMEAAEAKADSRLASLAREIGRIDPAAMEDDAFWSRALDALSI